MKRQVELTDPTPEQFKDELFHASRGDYSPKWPKLLHISDDDGNEYRHLTIWVEDGCMFIKMRRL